MRAKTLSHTERELIRDSARTLSCAAGTRGPGPGSSLGRAPSTRSNFVLASTSAGAHRKTADTTGPHRHEESHRLYVNRGIERAFGASISVAVLSGTEEMSAVFFFFLSSILY